MIETEIHAEYIVDEKSQKKAVVIPIKEWIKILEEIEELEDIREYDKAKYAEDEEIPFDIAIKEIESRQVK